MVDGALQHSGNRLLGQHVTYEYADRTIATGTTFDLGAATAAGKAFKPSADTSTVLTNLARYRRLLVSRTIQLRNSSGT
ncbi:MAG: hypothetical protein QM736_22635 [Vicinamibacterales bacterium]